MSIVRSLSVGEGDMFYIKHNSDNFTIIDCCMSDDDRAAIIKEIKAESKEKTIVRFVSTHPDDDHIRGLVHLDKALNILNFYCVENEVAKADVTADFARYCLLRDDAKKAFHIYRGRSRRWMNESSDERGSAGINIIWPIAANDNYQAALSDAEAGESPNNISCILTYSLEGGATVLWMGDLETEFMKSVQDVVKMPVVDIVFAPHHGRDLVPMKWLDQMKPKLVVIGEAPSEHLNYYPGYNTLTQNSAGDITFECVSGRVHVYVSDRKYSVDFLDDEQRSGAYGKYIGTLSLS